jgi:hypothetical protein
VRIQVIGDGASARALRGYLASLGYELADRRAEYTVRIEPGDRVTIEGLRGALAAEALHAVSELAGAPVEWRRAAAGSDRELRVTVGAEGADAVERGVLRALLRVTRHGQARTGWISRFLGRNR